MVSEADTGRCASEDVELPRGVDCEIQPRSHMGWREERHIPYTGMENSP